MLYFGLKFVFYGVPRHGICNYHTKENLATPLPCWRKTSSSSAVIFTTALEKKISIIRFVSYIHERTELGHKFKCNSDCVNSILFLLRIKIIQAEGYAIVADKSGGIKCGNITRQYYRDREQYIICDV